MVVEILEEKLDREYCDNAAQLMLKAVGDDLIGLLSDDECCENDAAKTNDGARSAGAVDGHGSTKHESSVIELPKTWEVMSKNEVGTAHVTWLVRVTVMTEIE